MPFASFQIHISCRSNKPDKPNFSEGSAVSVALVRASAGHLLSPIFLSLDQRSSYCSYIPSTIPIVRSLPDRPFLGVFKVAQLPVFVF